MPPSWGKKFATFVREDLIYIMRECERDEAEKREKALPLRAQPVNLP
jgi:hypothetical protein